MSPEQTKPAADLPELDEPVFSILDEVSRIRRDLHAHPELGHQEQRTTTVVEQRLRDAGLTPVRLPTTGLYADIEPAGWEHTIGLRADLDALPVVDETRSAFVSRNPGVAHACGHDMHTAVVLGAGLVLAELARAGRLRTRVRLVFQPAEETTAGAESVIEAGGIDSVDRIVALHCDPHLDTGMVGTRVGAITSATDRVSVEVTGSGGHTSRPHLTQDVVGALGAIVTSLPTVLSRRFDPRAGVSLVWGRVQAGDAPNAIPATGVLDGTLRCLDIEAWRSAKGIIATAVEQVAAPYGVQVRLTHETGVPPTVNDETVVALQNAAVRTALGPLALTTSPQSMGGEDFAWYLDRIPGALARLGVRRPGGPTHDLHRGDFDPDERAIEVGIRFLVASALMAPLV